MVVSFYPNRILQINSNNKAKNMYLINLIYVFKSINFTYIKVTN